jgi:DNA-binding transcriptional ArsR family regulator
MYFHYSGNMEMYEATEAFSSLSQETRLRVFRLLIEYGRDGLLAGKIAEQLKIPDNTLSFHLSHMSRAGLVKSQKDGRSISYFANTDLIEDLIGFLQANCCARETKSKSRNRSCNERKC